MTGASYNRGNSKQSVGTPREFIEAVEGRFGIIGFDMACSPDNCVCDHGFGPDWDNPVDSLDAEWTFHNFNLWLNPPFANIQPWAAKCESIKDRLGLTIMLVPASIGTNWYIDHVEGKSVVIGLSPRIKFIGHKHQYPKDLMLCVYGYGLHGHQTWRWK